MKDYTNYYKLPLTRRKNSSHVLDSLGNFVCQFMSLSEGERNEILNKINGKGPAFFEDERTFSYQDGIIKWGYKEVILMRGWGNLTGIGGFNLSEDHAIYVQDTFGKFIVKLLNGK